MDGTEQSRRALLGRIDRAQTELELATARLAIQRKIVSDLENNGQSSANERSVMSGLREGLAECIDKLARLHQDITRLAASQPEDAPSPTAKP